VKIYKFKDLSDEKKLSHFYQIVLEKEIWCAKPDSLNDENEFKFKLDYKPSSSTAKLLSQAIAKYRTVAKYRTTNYFPPHLSASLVLKNNRLEKIAAPIIEDEVNKMRRTIGVASFSMTKNDNLWNEYGGEGNGVCIEINIPDSLVGESYHRVSYVQEKIFHVDSFLKSDLFDDQAFNTYRDILSTKTMGRSLEEKMGWLLEEEIRFIAKRQEVNLPIEGSISEITFGARVPAPTLRQIEEKIGKHCKANNIKIAKLQ